jgi:hypothetical protein
VARERIPPHGRADWVLEEPLGLAEAEAPSVGAHELGIHGREGAPVQTSDTRVGNAAQRREAVH